MNAINTKGMDRMFFDPLTSCLVLYVHSYKGLKLTSVTLPYLKVKVTD